MSRMTVKYQRALDIRPNFPHDSADDLYARLTYDGYHWDTNDRRWVYESKSSQKASSTVSVRVSCDSDQVQSVADKLAELMQDEGYRLIEKSTVYPCRPPKGNDGRIYLTFSKQI